MTITRKKEPQVKDADVEEECKKIKIKRALRGRTQMHCLTVQRVKGVKQTVEFNEFGQPVGRVGSQMQSFIGVLAREKVNINYNRWTDVPNKVKDDIWNSVNLTFDIDPRWKVECIKSANNKWRQFKTELTTEYVFRRLDSPKLKDPPSDYHFITQSDWTSFLVSRLSDKFKKMREDQRQRRAASVYPHRLSRKGYAKFGSENVNNGAKLELPRIGMQFVSKSKSPQPRTEVFDQRDEVRDQKPSSKWKNRAPETREPKTSVFGAALLCGRSPRSETKAFGRGSGATGAKRGPRAPARGGRASWTWKPGRDAVCPDRPRLMGAFCGPRRGWPCSPACRQFRGIFVLPPRFYMYKDGLDGIFGEEIGGIQIFEHSQQLSLLPLLPQLQKLHSLVGKLSKALP